MSRADQVAAIFAEETGRPIVEETALSELDSLEVMNGLLVVEKTFGVKFADPDFAAMKTIVDVARRAEEILAPVPAA